MTLQFSQQTFSEDIDHTGVVNPMELRYENLRNKPKAFRSFTGFDVEEFQILLEAFTTAW